MKKTIVILALMTAQVSLAGTCKIKARAYESTFSCPTISFNKIKDMTLQDCENHAKNGTETSLYGILDLKSGQKVMHIDYKFTEGKYKVQNRLVVSDWTEYCGGGIL